MGKAKVLPSNKSANAALKSMVDEKPRGQRVSEPYGTFDALDGTHPWQDIMPEGQISYEVRTLKNGKIAYFNFALAKEMGLIPKDHPERMNKSLEAKLVETFSLRIINEYDIENKVYYPKESIKPNKYMATRYLQLQHKNKKGETSGDGRCIWNGTFVNKGTTWDVSSRGTGVTALAPGAVQSEEPLKSGNEDFGYGCGLAEIDELYSAAIMGEIIHHHDITTERMLTIVDLGGGVGIGVRAGKNLLRPAHLFMYLKQENFDALKRGTDYFILRQLQNKEWDFPFKSPKRYDYMLKEITHSFAHFVAQLEREYIFAWLDWDGDNVLGNAGIIDYGSVRQFGLRHDQYRYDDVERFSTNLNEQRAKARLTVQVFIQQVDYLKTRKKKSLNDFKDHPLLGEFDSVFEGDLQDYLLYQWGFKKRYREELTSKHKSLCSEFYKSFELLEKLKTHKKPERVADGINRPAILNMRKLTKFITEHFSTAGHLGDRETDTFSFEDLYQEILSEFAKGPDKQISSSTKTKMRVLIKNFKELVSACATDSNTGLFLENLKSRAKKINSEDRVTGNSLLYIVNEIMDSRKKGLKHSEVQKVVDNLISSQIRKPDGTPIRTKPLRKKKTKNLMETLTDIAQSHSEDI